MNKLNPKLNLIVRHFFLQNYVTGFILMDIGYVVFLIV